MNLEKTGLTSIEAKEKLTKYGLNEIRNISKNTPFKILLLQKRSNFIIYLLFMAAVISSALAAKSVLSTSSSRRYP